MEKKINLQSVSALLISMMFISASSASTANFNILDVPKFNNTAPNIKAMSADGTAVVGTTETDSGTEAFLFRNNQMIKLGYLDEEGSYSKAAAVSADGSTIVGQCNTINGTQAFIWQNSRMTALGRIGPNPYVSESCATAVSADGSIVVGYSYEEEEDYTGTEAFIWQNGQMTGLGDLSGRPNEVYSKATGVSADGSVVIGTTFNGKGQEAFRWENGKMVGLGFLIDSAYEPESYANAVSADGSIIVGYSMTLKGQQAFRWKGGKMVSLALSGSIQSSADGVSSDGLIIVGSYISTMGKRAFIWDEANGTRDLESLLKESLRLNLEGLELLEAMGISADGKTIMGLGQSKDGLLSQPWLATLP